MVRCGWCYGEEAEKRCSKCLKRCYCSRECQVCDWKSGHKAWCGCAGEVGADFEVRDAGAGKGLGVFALVALERGAKIMTERAALTKGGLRDGEAANAPEATIRAAMALMPEGGDLEAKVALNGMGCSEEGGGFGSDETGLFITMSRVNHACLANAVHYYHEDSGVKILVASRHIAAGEEITFNYVPAEQIKAVVDPKKLLAAKWKITACDCRACADPLIAAKLQRAADLDDNIIAFGQRADFARGLRCGEALLRIYDELQESPWQYSRTYYDMFQLAVARRSTMTKAKQYIKLAHDNRALFLGPKKSDHVLRNFARLMTSPETHRNYLIGHGR